MQPILVRCIAAATRPPPRPWDDLDGLPCYPTTALGPLAPSRKAPRRHDNCPETGARLRRKIARTFGLRALPRYASSLAFGLRHAACPATRDAHNGSEIERERMVAPKRQPWPSDIVGASETSKRHRPQFGYALQYRFAESRLSSNIRHASADRGALRCPTRSATSEPR